MDFFKNLFVRKENDAQLAFELDGKPSLQVAVPLGLQHILAMFAGNLAPILILSGVLGLPSDQQIYLVQMAMFASGIATFIQLYPLGKIGARLPIVMGTSFSFLGVAIVVGFDYGIAKWEWEAQWAPEGSPAGTLVTGDDQRAEYSSGLDAGSEVAAAIVVKASTERTGHLPRR